MVQDKIFKLKGKIQHYVWGGTTFIPQWLGMSNPENKPFAEYWMGAHPSAASTITINGEEKSLYDLIKDEPASFIGEATNKAFGELPYLFKILDVKDMLSIQVHPSKEAAAKGFDEEEANNILITASNRNYKDKNHKPEVLVALSEVWLLHGFLAEEKLLNVLRNVPELNVFEKDFLDKGYKGLYEHIMLMPQEASDKILSALIDKEIERKKNNELTKADAGWWVAKLYENEKPASNFDRGIFSIYLFNKVKVEPGEAVFQGAGVPHAYLEGQNVELMANSDNVLRGGLTPKHIDVPELLKHIEFEGIKPDIMKGNKITDGERNYPCPVSDFGISKIELNAGEVYQATTHSLEIIVVIAGEMQVAGTNNVSVKKGEAVAILPAETYSISTTGKVYAYKAFVP
jgi:mannose-6-phosphate isomerase